MVRSNFFLMLICFVFYACEQHYPYKREYYQALHQMQQNANDYYTIKDMFSHFPREYSLDSVMSLKGNLLKLPLSKMKNKIGDSFLILKDEVPLDIDSSIYSQYVPFYLGFKDTAFCSLFDTDALLKGKIPIPDINYVTYRTGLHFSQILFCDSQYGDFWKIPNTTERPLCLGKWKNGYSRGIGVYQDSTGWKKMYWVMYW